MAKSTRPDVQAELPTSSGTPSRSPQQPSTGSRPNTSLDDRDAEASPTGKGGTKPPKSGTSSSPPPSSGGKVPDAHPGPVLVDPMPPGSSGGGGQQGSGGSSGGTGQPMASIPQSPPPAQAEPKPPSGPFRWWQRLEGHPEDQALERSLEARVHDPAWLLARQWQLGEFRGENAASPVAARLSSEATPLRGYRPGPPASTLPWQPYDAARTPLETVIEREPATLGRLDPDGNWAFTQLRQATRAGQQLLRLLAQALSGDALECLRTVLIERFALPDPTRSPLCSPGAGRQWRALVSRVPDGVRMRLDCLQFQDTAAWVASWLPSGLSGSREQIVAVASAWISGWGVRLSEPEATETAWDAGGLAYDFSLSAAGDGGSGATLLHAREYTGQRLDWSAFDATPDATPPAGLSQEKAGSATRGASVIPQPITFPGMPLARFWSFEDAGINFAAVEAKEDDVARLALLDFMLIYGNDWFLLPIRQEVGHIHRLKPIQVFDAFGGEYSIGPTSERVSAGGWTMFELSQLVGTGAQRGLLLLPSIEGGLDGPVLEEVRFCRDELANLAWAIEEQVEGVGGRAISRHEQASRSNIETSATGELGTPVYQVGSGCPEHWIPLMPVRERGQHRIVLRRAQLAWPGADGKSLACVRPEGRFLTESHRLDIREQEVPRTGVRVTRAYQLARGTDGAAQLWLGRKRHPGRGDASSQFGWDKLIPPAGEHPTSLEPPEAKLDSLFLDFNRLT